MSKDEENNGPDNNGFIESGPPDNKTGSLDKADSNLMLDSNKNDQCVSSSDQNSENNNLQGGSSPSDIPEQEENSVNKQTDNEKNITLTGDTGDSTNSEESQPSKDNSDTSNSTTDVPSSVEERAENKDVDRREVSDREDQAENKESNGATPHSQSDSESKEDLGQISPESQEDNRVKETNISDKIVIENENSLNADSTTNNSTEVNHSDDPSANSTEKRNSESSENVVIEETLKTEETRVANGVENCSKDLVQDQVTVRTQESEIKHALDGNGELNCENTEKDDDYEDDFEDVEPADKHDKDVTEENIDTLEKDIKQAKEDWEKSISDNKEADSTVPETCGGEAQEPEEEVTKVVVDDDGIPKVLVTTVPDRPPSSLGSDIENDKEQVESDAAIDTGDSNKDTKANIESEDHSREIEGNTFINIENSDKTQEDNKDTNENAKESVLIDKKDTIDNKKDSDFNFEVCGEINETETSEASQIVSNGKTQFASDIESKELKESDEKYHTEDRTSVKMDSGKEDTDAHTTSPETDVKTDETNAEHTPNSNEEVSKDDSKPKEENETKPVVIETKTVESPLEKLLKRNVEIDGTVESITQLEQNVLTLLVSMKEVMIHYADRLKLQTLKDMTEDIGKFRGDFMSVNEAFKSYSAMTTNINQKLKELRHVTEDVKTQISRKFMSEDLSTWVDITPEQEKEKEKLQDEMIADEKAAMVRAAEARQAMATATVGVAQAHQFVTELEVQTAEAEAIAIKTAAQAKASVIAAEEARKAAEERRIAEEASKRRAEERARIKAEQEKKKQAEEEMVIHMEAAKKGTSVEDEREKFKREKARKEEERRNPKNWPRYSFNVAGTDFNPGIGCVIRAIDGSMRQQDVNCEQIDQSTGVLKLRENEELVSNIIKVNPTETDRKFSFEEPISVAFPVCFNRVLLGREAVVKQLVSSGAWKELPSAEVQFEDFREMKFIEGRTRAFGTFAVVLRLKKDNMSFAKKSSRMISSVDSRISFTSQNGTFKQAVNGILEVQSLDVNTITELKYRAHVECASLLTSSPVIKLTLSTKRLDKTLTVTLPLPSLQPRQTRPVTAIARPVATDDVRPATARPAANKEEENPEDIRFLYKDDKGNWLVNNKIRPTQVKNKDIVVFDILEPYERFLILRTKQGAQVNAVEKMATLLERTITQRTVQVSLRQHKDDASEVAVVCTTSLRTNKALRNLEEEGYTDGPNPSPDLILHEGQQIYMKFRGNIQCVSENPSFSFIFNSHIRTTRNFQVTEIDVFAQKSIHCFRGFVQMFTKALVPKPPTDGTQKAPGAQPEMVEAEILLAELLIELPKPEIEPPKPLRVAPVPINDSPLTHLVFRHLASELGKEWRELGAQLNLKPTRIQAILRQNVNKDTPQTRYDMLVTWAKRIPKGVDKVQILYSALLACGRPDLAEEVRYKGDEFKQQRHNRAKSSHLRQAFVKVAKAQAVFKAWKNFAKRLGVPDEEIERIDESGGSGQEKCFNSLQTWGKTAGDKATIPELSTHLKQVKQQGLSREVESITVS